jgi:hypothetical protein
MVAIDTNPHKYLGFSDAEDIRPVRTTPGDSLNLLGLILLVRLAFQLPKDLFSPPAPQAPS